MNIYILYLFYIYIIIKIDIFNIILNILKYILKKYLTI